MKDTKQQEQKKSQQRALKNRMKSSKFSKAYSQEDTNVGSYPKGDYRQGMPKKMMNLAKMKKQNKIITTLD